MRNSRRVAAFSLAAGMILVSAQGAWATLVQPVTLPELVKRSTTIVHGTVQETKSQWEEGGGQIYTYVTVSSREFLKGGSPDGTSVTFRQVGGQVGDQVVYVPGTPRFHAKEEVLVFLTGKDKGGYPQVMGIFQGAYRPVPGASGERRVVGLTPDALTSILPEKARAQAQPEKALPAQPLGGSFTDFLQRIRDLVQEQGGASQR
ncbi:MAG: hypothetical protein DMH00_05355 [Acidobacteria bacterium]|nr:MAG: hypothetical protein DMH00_05355 [Acidobacteriota bacterium]